MFKLEWTHEEPILSKEDQDKLEEEIERISKILEGASDLIYHAVLLTSDFSGPTIEMCGKENCDDTLFLTYCENTEWEILEQSD